MIVDINPVVGKYGNIIHSVESVHSYMYVSGHGRGGSRISIWGGGGGGANGYVPARTL